MIHVSRWPTWVLPSILLTAVLMNAFDFSVLVPRQDLRIAMHEAVVTGTAPVPQQHRVLVPFTIDLASRILGGVMPADKALTRAYGVFHVVALAALLAASFSYTRQWYGRDEALVVTLLVGSMVRLSLRQGEYWDSSPIPESSVFTPSSLLDAVLVGWALVAVLKQQRTVVLVLTAAASLNSEASILVPLIALGHALRTGAGTRLAALSIALWAAITIALRAAFGVEPLTFTWLENSAHFEAAALNLALFFGPSLLLAARGWRRAPMFARTALVSSGPFLAAFALFGYWWDVRVLLPLYPLMAPILSAGIWMRPE